MERDRPLRERLPGEIRNGPTERLHEAIDHCPSDTVRPHVGADQVRDAREVVFSLRVGVLRALGIRLDPSDVRLDHVPKARPLLSAA